MEKKLWIARDKSGALYLYASKPERLETVFVSSDDDLKAVFMENGCADTPIASYLYYPELTWENSPVELKLCL